MPAKRKEISVFMLHMSVQSYKFVGACICCLEFMEIKAVLLVKLAFPQITKVLKILLNKQINKHINTFFKSLYASYNIFSGTGGRNILGYGSDPTHES